MEDGEKEIGLPLAGRTVGRLEPLLPKHHNPHPQGGGRPRRPDRYCMEGRFFVLRTGCQWEALNATGIRPHSTAYDRFTEWVQAGVWQQL